MRIFAGPDCTNRYGILPTKSTHRRYTGEHRLNNSIMESKRQQKVARQLQRDLSEIFQRDVPHLFSGAFITVTSVRVSPDLSVARVYLSFLAAKNKDILLESIQEKGKVLRQHLGERVRHQLRIVPDLSFFLDDTAEYADKMDKLFSGLDIPPAPKEDQEDTE